MLGFERSNLAKTTTQRRSSAFIDQKMQTRHEIKKKMRRFPEKPGKRDFKTRGLPKKDLIPEDFRNKSAGEHHQKKLQLHQSSYTQGDGRNRGSRKSIDDCQGSPIREET